MIYLAAIGLGIVLGAALGFGWGMLAAVLYSNLAGPRDGGPAMAGFFTMAPIGFLVGFLLTFGFVLRKYSANPTLSTISLYGSGFVFFIGLIVFALPWTSAGGNTSRSKFDLSMQYEVPASNDLNRYKWGYQGHAEKGEATYSFYETQVEGEMRLMTAEMQMSDSPPKRTAMLATDGKIQQFDIPLPGFVNEPTEWSSWIQGDGVRFRWRVH